MTRYTHKKREAIARAKAGAESGGEKVGHGSGGIMLPRAE